MLTLWCCLKATISVLAAPLFTINSKLKSVTSLCTNRVAKATANCIATNHAMQRDNMNLAKLTSFHKEQISNLQQAIWGLEKAHERILYAKGNSEIGQCYARDIAELISNIQDDIDNIHNEYSVN
jgi:hypothetical protein